MEVGGPLVWSKTGNNYSYNLTIRENSFVQIWKQQGPNNRTLHHVCSFHVSMEDDDSMTMLGTSNMNTGHAHRMPTGMPYGHATEVRTPPRCRALRRSQRVAAKKAFEPITPTSNDIAAFERMLTSNLGLGGK